MPSLRSPLLQYCVKKFHSSLHIFELRYPLSSEVSELSEVSEFSFWHYMLKACQTKTRTRGGIVTQRECRICSELFVNILEIFALFRLFFSAYLCFVLRYVVDMTERGLRKWKNIYSRVPNKRRVLHKHVRLRTNNSRISRAQKKEKEK